MNNSTTRDPNDPQQRKRRMRRALFALMVILLFTALLVATRVPYVIRFADQSREVSIPIPPDLVGWEGVALENTSRPSLWNDLLDCVQAEHALGFVDVDSHSFGTSESNDGGVLQVALIIPKIEIRRFSLTQGRFAPSTTQDDDRLRQSIEDAIDRVVTEKFESSAGALRAYVARSASMRNELLAVLRSVSRDSAEALIPAYSLPSPGGPDQMELQSALDTFNALMPLAPLARGRAPIEVHLKTTGLRSGVSRVLDLDSLQSKDDFLEWLDHPSAIENRMRAWNLLGSELSSRTGVQISFTPNYSAERGPNLPLTTWVTEIAEECAGTSVEMIVIENNGRRRAGAQTFYDWRLIAMPVSTLFMFEDDGAGFPPVEEVLASLRPEPSDSTETQEIVRWNAGFGERTGLEFVDLHWMDQEPDEHREFYLGIERVLPDLRALKLERLERNAVTVRFFTNDGCGGSIATSPRGSFGDRLVAAIRAQKNLLEARSALQERMAGLEESLFGGYTSIEFMGEFSSTQVIATLDRLEAAVASLPEPHWFTSTPFRGIVIRGTSAGSDRWSRSPAEIRAGGYWSSRLYLTPSMDVQSIASALAEPPS